MSNNWANRRLLKIPNESVTRERKKHARFKPDYIPEDPDYETNGKKLIDELEESVKFCKRQNKIDNQENVFFVIETTKPVAKEDAVFNKQYIFSLQTGPFSAIVSANEAKLLLLKQKLAKYSTSSRYKTWVNEIKRISKISIDKMDKELEDSLDNSANVAAEIDLLPNLGVEYNESMVSKIQRFFIENGDEVVDSLIDNDMASLRVVAKPQTIKTVVQGLDSIWQARKAPTLHIDQPQSIKMEHLPALITAPIGAKTICLLDTGVDNTHPLLQSVITDSFDFTPDKDPTDFDSHGTFNAGLAIYGDLEGIEKRKSIDNTALLVNAKIQSRYPSCNIGYIEKRITEAVEKYHDIASIFSLSIMTEVCASLDFPSKLAHIIDTLSNKYGVLFVVSAGNIKKELTKLVREEVYPKYIGKDCCKIFWGGEACTSITVGGVALKENGRSIAKREQPSPFTRRGEYGNRGKPDVVANGGNLEIDESTRTLGENDAELGVVSLGLLKEPIAYSKGTSCSAPVIANTLAKLLKEYADASPILLKALLIHSARVPDAHRMLDIDVRLRDAVYGKGSPTFQSSAYCQNNAPTFFIEDTVKLDETASIPIFIPKIMESVAGLRKIRVSLIYNPPVDTGVEGYTLVDLDFQLNKQVRPGEFQTQRSNWDEAFRIPWDNVKTGTFSWLHSGWGLEWSLKIIPSARFRKRFDKKGDYEQKYAVVITVEDPTKKLNLYDEMSPKLKKPLKVPQKAKVYTQQELFVETPN